jgi:hypothetical protein
MGGCGYGKKYFLKKFFDIACPFRLLKVFPE